MRRLLLRLGMALWLPLWLPLCLALPVTAHAGAPVLRVLAWPGYAEPEVIQEFEAQTRSRVEITTIHTDEALWQRITSRTEPAFDVFAVNTAELQRYLSGRLLQPIDTAQLPRTEQQQPRFRQVAAIPGLVRSTAQGNEVYAIPFTYSGMGLIFDKRQVQTAPDSIEVLWDARWQGRILAYNGGAHNFSLAAQSMGLNNPFHIPAEQTATAVARLIDLRRNALGFYTQPEESVRMFLRHKAAIMFANYGMQQVQLLRAAGVEVGYAIPREGALAWLDCWAIPRNARQPALAHAWINHLLGPTASRLLTIRQGLANTVSPPDNGSANGNLIWLQPVEDAARREQLWERIHAGDSLSKVMAP